MNTKLLKALYAAVAITLLAACAGPVAAPLAGSANSPVKLTLAGYSTPAEAYGKIVPLFVAYWKEQNNQDVSFEQSYGGARTQIPAGVWGLVIHMLAPLFVRDGTN